MLSWRNGIVWAALSAALLTAILTYSYLGRIGGSAQVLVAATDLTAPVRLNPEHLRLETMPLSAIHPQALTSPTVAVDRYLLVPVVKGQMILEPHLAAREGGGPVASRLSPGHVAFFVPISTNRSLGGAVEEGDRVDFLLVTGTSRYEGPAAHNIVRGVRVLDIRDESGRRFDRDGKGTSTPAGLLVEVLPDDATRLAYGLEQGTIYAMVSSSAVGGARGELP